MTEFVKPFKMESTAGGGLQNDQQTTEIDPINDSLPIASVCLQRTGNTMDDAVRVARDSNDNLLFVDKVSGSKTLAQIVTASGISALTGDVTASGTGSVAATVASVGGASASNVASAAALVAASRAANSFYAGPTSGTGTAAFRALVAADLPTIPLAKLDVSGASGGYVPTYNGTSYVAAAIAALTALTGDVTASGSGSQAATVAAVGGQTASAVASATALVVGSKTSNYVLAAPNGASGSASFRLLVAADVPTLPASQISGLAASATTDATNAANITSGTLPSARISGSYTGITAIGTLTAGTVPTTLLSGTVTLGQISTSGATNGQVIAYNGTSLAYTTVASGITALTGDVTASGSGSQAATVASIGGQTAASVASATSLVSGSKTANYVLAGPSGSNGSAAFRALVAADIPALPASIITSGTFASALLSGNYTGITGVGTLSAGAIPIGLLTSTATSGYVLTVSNGAITAAAPAAASVSYPLTAPNGTDAAPSYSFTNATGAGMLYNGSALDFAFGGTSRLTINSSTLASSLPISSTAAGSLTACTLQVGAANTGLYYPAASNLALAAGGTQVGLFTSNSASFPAAASVSFAAATAMNFGAAVVSFSSTSASLQFPTGAYAVAATTDTSQGLVFANNFLRLYGPGGATYLYLGNNSSFYGAGIGVTPQTTANNALALSGALSINETAAPATVAAYTHAYANSTDHHLYANNPTYGQVCLTNGGVPVSKSTTAATTTVTLSSGDNGRTWLIDGTFAGTSTINLPASSSTTDQTFKVMQTQATYGYSIVAAASTNMQMGTVVGATAGSLSANQTGCSVTLFLAKGKTTWIATSYQCTGSGVFTLT